MSDIPYNGWPNYETWCVKLWLDQSEDQDYAEQIFTIFAQEQGKHKSFDDQKEMATYLLGQGLRQEHEEASNKAMPGGNGVFRDLLDAALQEVNWTRIAESLMSNHEVDLELYYYKEARTS